MSRDFPPVLVRLIPRLGSPFDHEFVATARAIERTLKSQKLDWHDVAAAVTALAPPVQRNYEPRRTESEMRAWLTAISSEDWINEWTAEFVSSLLRRSSLDKLSERQLACIMENGQIHNVNGGDIAGRQRAHRSAVSNGTRLFCVDGLDGRSQTARRFRDLVEGMGNDLGGSDRLSEGQRQLIRRAATLSIMSESVEADFIRNLAFDSEAYGVLCDRLGRCLQRLGLERKPRDVTPDLRSYLAAKDRPA
jgi:hypothetical protein